MRRSMMSGRIDGVLAFSTILIALLGIMFLFSATWVGDSSKGISPLVYKQSIWVIFGVITLFVIANSDYRKLLDFAYPAYALNIIGLVLILIFGGERLGAKRWIDVGIISIQPSEIVKITVVLSLSSFLGSRKDEIASLKIFIQSFLLISPAALLIFLQPDLGTSLVLIPILFSILFICGGRIKYLVATISAGLFSMPFLWMMLKDYQKSRLLVFLNPNIDPLGAGYTIAKSKIAIGSGGLAGKGWLNGTQSYLRFLPERHTDFIFSVIGEEWGFIGAVALLGLFSVVITRGIRIMQDVDDIYGKAIATGVITLMAFQVFVNISMTIGLMPVVGLPLPLITYGGSSLFTTLIGVGFLLSVGRRANR